MRTIYQKQEHAKSDYADTGNAVRDCPVLEGEGNIEVAEAIDM